MFRLVDSNLITLCQPPCVSQDILFALFPSVNKIYVRFGEKQSGDFLPGCNVRTAGFRFKGKMSTRGWFGGYLGREGNRRLAAGNKYRYGNLITDLDRP